MIKKLALIPLALGALCLPALANAADAEIGKPAPAFTATDTNGKTVTLGDFKGKPVVLEWTNHECPFVRKQYDTGNMQKVQETATKDGVVWISIVSSAKDKEGHTTAAEANAIIAKEKAHPTHKILDEDGSIGKLYGAKTTPHMFVIDKDGTLAYAGAIDDNPSHDPKTVAGAKNYVLAALDDLKQGQSVTTPSTQPYGCGVKY